MPCSSSKKKSRRETTNSNISGVSVSIKHITIQLNELQLNRYLYKTQPQTLETQGSDTLSSNINPAPSTAVASGNTVIDINTNSMTINGNQLTPGTIPTATLDIANWGWTQTCAFTVTDADTVAWGAGTFKSADGVLTYSINAGNTGNMAAKTYVYLDINVSTTAYQTTTNILTPIGIGKVLIAVCDPGSATATYNLVQASQIVGDNILANSINANRIVAGSITATQINASYVYAGTINASQINAGTITGFTIVGSTLSTATTGQRTDLTSTIVRFYNSSNTLISHIFASNNWLSFDGDQSTSSFYFNTGSTGTFSFLNNGNLKLIFDGNAEVFAPYVAETMTLGASSYPFLKLFTKFLQVSSDFTYKSTNLPGIAHGYVTGTTLSKSNVTYIITSGGTGIYDVSHGLGTVNYTVQATAFAVSGGGALIAKVSDIGTNGFSVILFDENGTATAGAFMFLLLKN